MGEPRSFGDPSPDARALDVLGDRWALLVVRELLFGPRRFGELRRALPRTSPSVLAARLRELGEQGVLGPDPASGGERYVLSELGRGLRPVLVELVRWGHRLPVSQPGQGGVAATLLELQAWFDAGRVPGGLGLVVRFGPDAYRLRAAGGGLEVTAEDSPHGAAGAPRLVTDVATFRAVAFGTMPLAAALDHRLARLDGPPGPVLALVAGLDRPSRAAGPAPAAEGGYAG